MRYKPNIISVFQKEKHHPVSSSSQLWTLLWILTRRWYLGHKLGGSAAGRSSGENYQRGPDLNQHWLRENADCGSTFYIFIGVIYSAAGRRIRFASYASCYIYRNIDAQFRDNIIYVFNLINKLFFRVFKGKIYKKPQKLFWDFWVSPLKINR